MMYGVLASIAAGMATWLILTDITTASKIRMILNVVKIIAIGAWISKVFGPSNQIARFGV